jgi:hypothetical protein
MEQLKVYCPADVSAKWWACFNRLPELNVGITLYIDGRKLPVRYYYAPPNPSSNRLRVSLLSFG